MARYGYDYELRDERPGARYAGLPNRVTARYNRDYVDPSYRDDERYPVNPYRYMGDRQERIGDIYEYVRPYNTIGGTHTWRGSTRPMGWERGRGDAPGGGHGSSRPWVGGYRPGYQGGSGGIAMDTLGPLENRGRQGGYDREYGSRSFTRGWTGYDRGYGSRYDRGYDSGF